MTKILTDQVLLESISIDAQFGHILAISDEKPVASFGQENPFSLIPDLDPASVDNYFAAKGIEYFSTPPWVADGQFAGLTVFWKKDRLQQLINENIDLVKRSMWPTNAHDFGMKLNTGIAKRDEDPEMYKFIAKCFNDKENME